MKWGATMSVRLNIFGKVIILIILLLIPIIALYTYSYRVSVNVVENEMNTSALNRLSFLEKQFQNAADQLSISAIILTKDRNIRDYMNENQNTSEFDKVKLEFRIIETLMLQSATSGWMNQFSLFFPKSKKVISTDFSEVYDENKLKSGLSRDWNHRKLIINGQEQTNFTRHVFEPDTGSHDLDDVNLVIEVRFTDENLITMLNQFKSGSKGDPFLYDPHADPIVNRTGNLTLVNELTKLLDAQNLGPQDSQIVKLNEQKYVVNYVKTKNFGIYLVDYFPLEDILSPITKSRNLFAFSIGLLLIMSGLASLLLYHGVLIPIRQLVHSVKKMQWGDYSVRLVQKPNNEFAFLFNSFNRMVEQIEQLIENVYKEKIRSREATLKQLQSQINPHFLYNCLFYIKNMARLEDNEAIVAMTLNLGEYYRFMTRVENPLVSVEEELKLVKNYLVIQNLRMRRIQYIIDLPDEMLAMQIPRLLLQPIVENGIIHGIEPMAGQGLISISGIRNERENIIFVEDNGIGMTEEAVQTLRKKLSLPMDDDMGCGLWNVHQRLKYQFGEGSGLAVTALPTGGLHVVLKWVPHENGEIKQKVKGA